MTEPMEPVEPIEPVERMLREHFTRLAAGAPVRSGLSEAVHVRVRRRRARVTALATAVAVLVTVGAGAAAVRVLDPGTERGFLTAAGQCAGTYSPDAVAGLDLAFDGTVIEVGPGVATFAVDEWFSTAGAGQVVVDMSELAAPTGVPDPAYEVGTRLLVSGVAPGRLSGRSDPVAWGCGYTRAWDAGEAARWRVATGDTGGCNSFEPVTDPGPRLTVRGDTLPAGWAVADVEGSTYREAAACPPLSLAAVEVGADGVVVGTLRVDGPYPGPVPWGFVGTESRVAVDGHDAVRYVDEERDETAFKRWVWTDEFGQLWVAEVDGYGLAESEAVVAGLSADARTVTWDGTGRPGLDVVHRHDGSPARAAVSVSWTVTLGSPPGDGPPATASVSRTDPAEPLLAQAQPGMRVVDLPDGRTALVSPLRSGEGSVGYGPQVSVELAPGTQVWAVDLDADADATLDVLAALELVPAEG